MDQKETLAKIRRILLTVSMPSHTNETLVDLHTLAYDNYQEAMGKFKGLACETLNSTRDITRKDPSCESIRVKAQKEITELSEIKDIVASLERFRDSYMASILRPKVREYLTSDKLNEKELGKIYNPITGLDGLIKLGEFFDRLGSP